MTERFTKQTLTPDRRPRFAFEYFAVGSGRFPIDMLRYDRCWPARGEDAAKIEGDDRTRRTIKLLSYSEPTPDRWSSFTWSITGIGSR